MGERKSNLARKVKLVGKRLKLEFVDYIGRLITRKENYSNALLNLKRSTPNKRWYRKWLKILYA